MAEETEERFFARIRGSLPKMVELQRWDLDLIAPTARVEGEEMASIEAILGQGEIDRLRAEGYQVEMQASVAERSRVHEVMSLEEWRHLMGEE
jgi:hypothetical protein